MGEDRVVIQDELESEPSSDSVDGEESEEEKLDDFVFVVGPRDTTASGTTKASGASSSAPKARKRTTDGGAAQEEEAKQARVEQCSEVADAGSVGGACSPRGALKRGWPNELSREGRAGLPD
jgi:hypothetical protein